MYNTYNINMFYFHFKIQFNTLLCSNKHFQYIALKIFLETTYILLYKYINIV